MLMVVAGHAFAARLFCPPATIEEKVILFTDRSIYIAGEQIQFSASLFSSENKGSSNVSRILYCELVTPDGNIITNKKFLINQLSAAGCILIPKDQVTGTYYIRAYTKLMREFGPFSYEYKQIRIINPKSPDVLVSDTTTNIHSLENKVSKLKELNAILSVSLDKKVFASRDTITISYQQANSPAIDIKSISLSIVPENSASTLSFQPFVKELQKAETGYYPETRGLSLVGKLTEASSSITVPDKRINLSIIGEGRDFMVTRTDSLGRFYFALPNYYGSRDLFLCAEKTPSQAVKIWVDNDFCTMPFQLPSPKFYLTELERLTAQNMAQNVQIDSHFRNNITVTDSTDLKTEVTSFYGKPTTVLYLDKYIMLPTLEDYFNELPSQVKVRKRKGESYFVVQGEKELSFYDPLVMVDWVAVDEPSKILAITPMNVSRIEVVNEDYVKGGHIYGGIISIISKKGDFAGVDLPSTGIFINFRFLSENQCFNISDKNSATIPDARNTILWEPSLKEPNSEIKNATSTTSQLWKPAAQAEQKSQIEKIVFTAPDTPGKYAILFDGVTTNGELFSVKSVFEVKN